MKFSPDGSKLASASDDNEVIVWDPNTGTPLHTLEGHWDLVRAVQFSPDGSKLASASRDNNVIVWDLNTTLPIQTIDVKTLHCEATEFCSFGQRLILCFCSRGALKPT